MASSTASLFLFTLLSVMMACLVMAAPATTDSPAATTTSDKSFAAVTATPTYDTEGLPASIFPVLTGYPDEYESTTELDDGILYLSEQDEGTKF
ncbi:hypothetical protein V8B55DRAFT_1498214 [Mucor lusitanicus]|uniref:Uncharacterized protein n=1 Tax=Mucor circinelloides f. lusitanicus TaxID=29924 RepID=A0A8H4BMC0_MUCCL|nr:hypothetical protein FB192DRAFT_1358851 [Mucor lusitanicus]